jgi:hypothetical protein
MKFYGPHSHYKHDYKKKKEQRRGLKRGSAAQLPSMLTTELRKTANKTSSLQDI